MAQQLTPREEELLRLLGEGRTTREIAERVGMAESTVVWYVGHLAARIGAGRIDALATSLARREPEPSRPSLSPLPLAAIAFTLIVAIGAAALVSAGVLDGVHMLPLMRPAASAGPDAPARPRHVISSAPPNDAADTAAPPAPATIVPLPSIAPTPTAPPVITLPPLPTLLPAPPPILPPRMP